MMKKSPFIVIFCLFLLLSVPLMALGGDPSGVDFPTSADTGLSDMGIKDILVNILEWMLGIIGVIALIGFVISGSMYILSTGDEKQAEKAKSAMTNSIIGIVVVLASFVIIQAIDIMLGGVASNF